ncbi:MAG: glycosyltransferase [Muribaculaceae bacterium]|nr:glycosyltransferase [Muribaculaceae bacterium]
MNNITDKRHIPLLTIILPCYNVSRYIERCLMSIVNQKVDYAIEIIAVNDASTDETGKILNNLKKRYNNLTIIEHEENQKLTGARSSGMRNATGVYIMHVDPDDYLLPDSLNNLFTDNLDWDILITNIQINYPNHKERRYNLNERIYNLVNEDDRNLILREVISGSCFGKVIKRDLVEDLIYQKYHYNLGEDRAFNLEVFLRAKNILYKNVLLYNYCYNYDSLDRSKTISKTLLNWDNSWIKNVLDIDNKMIISKDIKNIIRKEIERYTIGLLLRISRSKDKRDLFNQWRIFFYKQLSLYGIKKKIYKLLLAIQSFDIAYPLYLIAFMNIDAYFSRISNILKAKSI